MKRLMQNQIPKPEFFFNIICFLIVLYVIYIYAAIYKAFQIPTKSLHSVIIRKVIRLRKSSRLIGMIRVTHVNLFCLVFKFKNKKCYLSIHNCRK